MRKNEGGFTLVEMVTALGVFSMIALSILGLYTTLISTAIVMKQKSIALSVATNQLEYVKSLPFSGLAVSGGSIFAVSPIPASVNKTVNKVTYTVKTSINYVDDAFDGCGAYPNADLKALYCRNQPAPTGAVTDSNPQDYKIINIKVLSKTGSVLAETDTQIAAKVAETASTTGALFVTVIDDDGNKIAGANVNVVNATTTPATNLNDTTDSNGVALFYGLQPDSSYDYTLTASKSGFSSVATIASSGSLTPTYPNLQVLTQQSSNATLRINGLGANSLLIESTDTNGNPLANQKIMTKGGYKKYTLTTNTEYYYANTTSPDTRPTTDGSGLTVMSNLVPGPYIFCGDLGTTSCSQYLVAAIPYAGTNSLNPITIPSQSSTADPGTPYIYGSSSYLQKVRLMFSTNANFPRIRTLTPDNLSASTTPLTAFSFQIAGTNLPCSNVASSCITSVKLKSTSTTYTASCIGNTGSLLNCKVNLTGVSTGMLQLIIATSSGTLTLPVTPLQGGINVLP